MEELKHEQELRERRNQERGENWRDTRQGDISAPSSRFDELPDEFDPMGRPGSFDDGDPQTTNLYVGNLSPQVDENFLLRTFGRFGPIASVKIMWPRTEEERRRQRNCGFVAFMNRADAQAAKDEMQGLFKKRLKTFFCNPGVVVYEYELKIGWGKSVSLPSQALPAPPPGHMAIRSKEVLTPNVPDISVVPPDDNHLQHVIDTMALYVLDGGCAFEQAIMERGQEILCSIFYLSLVQRNILTMFGGSIHLLRWIPPPLPTAKGPDHEKEAGSTYAAGKSKVLSDPALYARVEVEQTLTDAQRDEFEDMLRALTLERSQIKEAMGFALDNADAAGEERVLKVLQVWADWFLFSDAYVNGLRATFLRSSNSGVTPFHSICGDAPELERKSNSTDTVGGDKINPDAALAIGKGAAMKELLNLPLTELERRCRHNGLSLVGGREMMVARLLYLEEAEKQRGYELDDELKSAHSQSSSGRYPSGRKEVNFEMDQGRILGKGSYKEDDMQSIGRGSGFLPQANLTLQPDLNDSEGKMNPFSHLLSGLGRMMKVMENDRSARELGLTYSSSGSEDAGDGRNNTEEVELTTDASNSAHLDGGMNEEQRQKMRRLEVALMEYRESLEERGIKSSEEIERKVAIHRSRLQAEYGLLDSNANASGRKPSSERRDVRDDSREPLKKRRRSESRSESPQRKLSRDRERDSDANRDRERRRDRERAHDFENDRGRDREKSGSRERDDHDREKTRERDRDRRRVK
ncbi:hypothetical protein DH2020_029131 [Rehmannia glutinosa]|uniref:RRM domain-containing protein n=1 Tax=Rehmannia glutinosa TaxID=99300 RepID=A0ABR0VQ87_REHGL